MNTILTSMRLSGGFGATTMPRFAYCNRLVTNQA